MVMKDNMDWSGSEYIEIDDLFRDPNRVEVLGLKNFHRPDLREHIKDASAELEDAVGIQPKTRLVKRFCRVITYLYIAESLPIAKQTGPDSRQSLMGMIPRLEREKRSLEDRIKRRAKVWFLP